VQERQLGQCEKSFRRVALLQEFVKLVERHGRVCLVALEQAIPVQHLLGPIARLTRGQDIGRQRPVRVLRAHAGDPDGRAAPGEQRQQQYEE
jgi:hypothetical protein